MELTFSKILGILVPPASRRGFMLALEGAFMQFFWGNTLDLFFLKEKGLGKGPPPVDIILRKWLASSPSPLCYLTSTISARRQLFSIIASCQPFSQLKAACLQTGCLASGSRFSAPDLVHHKKDPVRQSFSVGNQGHSCGTIPPRGLSPAISPTGWFLRIPKPSSAKRICSNRLPLAARPSPKNKMVFVFKCQIKASFRASLQWQALSCGIQVMAFVMRPLSFSSLAFAVFTISSTLTGLSLNVSQSVTMQIEA